MCACKAKKSFLIEDILGDSKANVTRHNGCCRPNNGGRNERTVENGFSQKIDIDEPVRQVNGTKDLDREDPLTNRVLEQRRNTYPLCPMPVKPGLGWGYKTPYELSPARQYAYYRESLPEQLLRSHFANMRFVSHSAPLRHPYNLDRVGGVSGAGWWAGRAGAGWVCGGRRKGGQVRFSAAQTGALERRFAAAKYLSPDERRALATALSLSDRQVKTWYQNRRAKWRRSTADCDEGSPADSRSASDQDEPTHQDTPHTPHRTPRATPVVTSH